ncbi:MAG: hypothetical protein KAV82_07275 [Phycisphaerae bacterium]|nr:hypothetical protein [Phycisphaerae bacterium]
MAVARGQAKGGVSGIHIWLIIFVALWLTSSVLLVLLYTDQKGLEQTNNELRDKNNSTRTELRTIRESREALAEVATGEAGDTVQDAQLKMRDLLEQIDEIMPEGISLQGDSYLQVLRSLYDAFKRETETLAQANTRNARLVEQIEELTTANTTQKDAFDEQIVGLGLELKQLHNDWEKYRQKRDVEVDGLKENLDDLDTRFSGDIQKQRSENKRLLTESNELQNRYNELKERLGELQIRPQELLTARQADGRVVRARPGDEVVYIDLGHDAGLVLGLQFAVYSAASGIPAGGQGKARIEVVNIFDDAAECRIVARHRREPILEDDLVANPVFDPERSLQFMVAGQFDSDGDGAPEPEGAQQVESLIRDWGGTVTQELSARVDFLVIGASPPKPFIMSDASPEAQERFDTAQELYDDYNNTLDTAQALSIPMLPRSVFMCFLGYAGNQR